MKIIQKLKDWWRMEKVTNYIYKCECDKSFDGNDIEVFILHTNHTGHKLKSKTLKPETPEQTAEYTELRKRVDAQLGTIADLINTQDWFAVNAALGDLVPLIAEMAQLSPKK